VRRPSSVRIDVLSPFGLALAVGTDGGLLWAYPAGQGTRYEGAATPANLARFLGTPATVADVVDVLLGTAPRRTPAGPSTLRATVVYDAAEPNAAVDAALFAPPPASHVVPLDTAGPRP